MRRRLSLVCWRIGLCVAHLACAARGFHLVWGQRPGYCGCCGRLKQATRRPWKTREQYRAWLEDAIYPTEDET